jgi:hypothetical protein
MFCETYMHGQTVRHLEILKPEPLGTNDSLLIAIVKNASKWTYVLCVLQCWKGTAFNTGYWQRKPQVFVDTSSAWRLQSIAEKENQRHCYCCDYNKKLNNLWCSVLYTITMTFMTTKVPRKVPHTFQTSTARSEHCYTYIRWWRYHRSYMGVRTGLQQRNTQEKLKGQG